MANTGIPPTPYDVLACLTKYNPESLEDFCANYGYDINSESTENIYNAVYEEWEGINRIFTDKQLELLREIN